jgi:hypothetical protein
VEVEEGLLGWMDHLYCEAEELIDFDFDFDFYFYFVLSLSSISQSLVSSLI